MIYTIPYQNESLLSPKFFAVRSEMNLSADRIHLTVKQSIFEGLPKEDIYKIILKLEGQFRSQNDRWSESPAQVEIVSQL